jgi:hypothetical protein
MYPGRVKSLIRDANDELRCRHGYTIAIPELKCRIDDMRGHLFTNSSEHETDLSLSRGNETSRFVEKEKDVASRRNRTQLLLLKRYYV